MKKVLQRESVQWAIVIAVICLTHIVASGAVGYLYRKDFVPNGREFAYADGVPLHEMTDEDFARYDRYLNKSIVAAAFVKKVFELPCDVEYYERKTDLKPAYILKKGTGVYTSTGGLGYGYGTCCWPDYDTAWRYGRPFTNENQSENRYEMYYVKEKQLKKVLEAIYDQCIVEVPWYLQSFQTYWIRKFPIRGWYVEDAITRIDKDLYEGGVFCAPYFSLQRVRNEAIK